MKKEAKEIKFTPISVSQSVENKSWCGDRRIYTYEIETTELIDLRQAKLFIDVEVPETMGEFLNKKKITKNELVEWLNKNYK